MSKKNRQRSDSCEGAKDNGGRMIEISKGAAIKLKSDVGDRFTLHSTFTRVEGYSYLTSHWKHIETVWNFGPLMFEIKTIKEKEDSEPVERYRVWLDKEYFLEQPEQKARGICDESSTNI
jgi:hypothetical protein